jgi:hypothetical protein
LAGSGKVAVGELRQDWTNTRHGGESFDLNHVIIQGQRPRLMEINCSLVTLL